MRNKGNYQQTKSPPTEWDKVFANAIPGKGLIYKVYNSTSKKKKSDFKMPEDLNRHFSKRCMDGQQTH